MSVESTLRTQPSGFPHAGSRDHGFTGSRSYIALLLFIATEAMFFAGLISAFLVFRNSMIEWPPPGQPRLPMRVTAMNTLALLFSALTMHLATISARRQDPLPMRRWLLTTLVCGSLFLLGQGSEWAQLIRHGLTLTSSVYGAIFYAVIGTHALHVFAAVVVLAVVIVKALRGAYSPQNREGLALCRVYWFFVVGLWPVLYTLVYLT